MIMVVSPNEEFRDSPIAMVPRFLFSIDWRYVGALMICISNSAYDPPSTASACNLQTCVFSLLWL